MQSCTNLVRGGHSDGSRVGTLAQVDQVGSCSNFSLLIMVGINHVIQNGYLKVCCRGDVKQSLENDTRQACRNAREDIVI